MTIFNYLKNFNLGKGSVVFEIGCHHGYDTEKILNICPDSKVYIFEPDPRNISIIKKRNIDKKARLVESCVSDDTDKKTFHLSSGLPPVYFDGTDQEIKDFCQNGEWTASSSIKRPKEHLEVTPWCTFEKTIEVESVTIDSFCIDENIQNIDFIWMDVQGAEDLVLEGASQMLTHDKINYIFTEYSNVELYQDQMSLKQMTQRLPNYEIVDFFNEGGGTDVLLKNKNS